MNNDCDDRIKRIKDKEETVRKLKMVKLHRTKVSNFLCIISYYA